MFFICLVILVFNLVIQFLLFIHGFPMFSSVFFSQTTSTSDLKVYLANGAEKQTLLGRVAAAGSKPVFFKVHAAYKTGQNLLAAWIW